MYIELEDVIDIENLLNELQNFDEVFEVNISPSTDHVWGKRIIIIGGGHKYHK